MIHLLTEGGNSTLIKRKVKAPLGRDIKKHLLKVFNNFIFINKKISLICFIMII